MKIVYIVIFNDIFVYIMIFEITLFLRVALSSSLFWLRCSLDVALKERLFFGQTGINTRAIFIHALDLVIARQGTFPEIDLNNTFIFIVDWIWFSKRSDDGNTWKGFKHPEIKQKPVTSFALKTCKDFQNTNESRQTV